MGERPTTAYGQDPHRVWSSTAERPSHPPCPASLLPGRVEAKALSQHLASNLRPGHVGRDFEWSSWGVFALDGISGDRAGRAGLTAWRRSVECLSRRAPVDDHAQRW
jgi:hypothetical protein